MKKWGSVADDEDLEQMRCKNIDLRTDRLKEIILQISVWVVFFVAAPFAMYCLYVGLS
ncbi:MAG: hypothetical protein HQK62_02030 [Desulfamplus sp.]|nr:hypothetical protein [Desulfamplus sp.]MBF0257607.1 hypothetical protein [Desulfamplus sp.]